MRRLLLGLASLLFLLVTAALVIPFFLPKDLIKNQVIAQVDQQFGWRLRLDGPVSLSLFPGFALNAEQIGLSGEAGADGIEFAKAEGLKVGLAWGGLLGGDIRITGVHLEKPGILMDIGPSGLTSWEPRRRFGTNAPDTTVREIEAVTESAAPAPSQDQSSSTAFLERVGIDQLTISDGMVRYTDHRSGTDFRIAALNLSLSASSLTGVVELESDFQFQEKPLSVAGQIDNPLAFAAGEVRPLLLNIASNEAKIGLEGSAGLKPLQIDLAVQGSAPSANDLLALADLTPNRDLGAFELGAKVTGDPTRITVADLAATLGSLSVSGSSDTDLSLAVPQTTGRITIQQAALSDLLALAGQDRPAQGTLGADLAFGLQGTDAPTILATLNANGSLTLDNGEVGGLGLASSFGGDPEADRIKDVTLRVDVNGLDDPLRLTGGLSWKGDGFTVTGSASVAPILAGLSAPVSAKIKSSKVALGFDGQASATGNVEGAVSVDTPNLRGLLAWIGQTVEAGSGLQAFKASGLFAKTGNTVSFDETSFMLDGSSGRASGKVTLGGRPTIQANMVLDALVLDPYLSGGGGSNSQGSASSSSGSGTSNTTVAAPAPRTGAKWSTAPIDFGGLKAADVDFRISTQSIKINDIKIGRSQLAATIENGMLTANLEELNLYQGNGTGSVTLNGASATPEASARFALNGVRAYPLLRDSADFEWLDGGAAINLNVSTRGRSQNELVSALNGTAGFTFEDGAIRGINIPRMVRGLSVDTLLGWQENPEAKTDFSSLKASFQIQNGVATNQDLSLVGPLVQATGQGVTNLPNKTLDWRVDPKVVPSLEGGSNEQLAGLGVPVMIRGDWDNPQIYPDIQGILENPEAAYKQLQALGGDLFKDLNKKPEEALAETANKVIERATGGKAQIDIQKVIDGEVNDQEILKSVEDGFGLPSGLLQGFGRKPKN